MRNLIFTLAMAFMALFALPVFAGQYKNEAEVFAYLDTGVIQGAVPMKQAELKNKCTIQHEAPWLPAGWDPFFTLTQTICLRENKVVAYFLKKAEADKNGKWFGWPDRMGIAQQASAPANGEWCEDGDIRPSCTACTAWATGGDTFKPNCEANRAWLAELPNLTGERVYEGQDYFYVRVENNLYGVEIGASDDTVEFPCARPQGMKPIIGYHCKARQDWDAPDKAIVIIINGEKGIFIGDLSAATGSTN